MLLYLLTYYGDDVIVNTFSSIDKAVNYAAQEVEDCVGEFNRSTQILTRATIDLSDYSYMKSVFEDESVYTIILDQDGGDFRLYTVKSVYIDPEYKSHFG